VSLIVIVAEATMPPLNIVYANAFAFGCSISLPIIPEYAQFLNQLYTNSYIFELIEKILKINKNIWTIV